MGSRAKRDSFAGGGTRRAERSDGKCRRLNPMSGAQGPAPLQALFLAASLFLGGFAVHGAETGKVFDRNGVLLMEIEREGVGRVSRNYPLKAFAAQLLHDLNPAVLPEPGEILYLTIDARAQMAVELALRAVPRGCAILLDPQNGDVLAMASVPSFDPGAFDEVVLRQDETDPLRNRALSAYAPGAIFLPVTGLAGLARHGTSFQHDCTGSLSFGSRTMNCWIAAKGGGHGKQTLAEGMKNSCNTFFYALGADIGPGPMTAMAQRLGWGRVSGLPLRGEAPGLVAIQSYLRSIRPKPKLPSSFRDLPDWSRRSLEWLRPPWTANMVIGQGDVLATPLQMASFAATLGNGGDVHQLRLIDRKVRPGGQEEIPPVVVVARLADAGLTAGEVSVVRDALLASVNAPDGNAQKGKAPGLLVGGRTGTAQFWRNGQKDSHTAFIGFAYSGDKQYAFCVFVQGAKSGGSVAAPLAVRILTSLDKFEPAALEPASGSFRFTDALL